MVHMRCQHLHSEVTQTQRLWRALLSTRQSCQTRQVTNLARSTKVSSFLNEIDSMEQQLYQKTMSKRRIPVHVSNSVNKQLSSPVIFSIHSHLQKNEIEQAWKLLDKSITVVTHIPYSTAHMLLQSLYNQVEANLPRLQLNFGKLQHLYFTRLETLAGLVRQSNIPLWDKTEFCTVIEIYGRLDQLKRAESIFRNISHYCNSQPTTEHYNSLLSAYVSRFKFMDEVTRKRCLSRLKTLELEMSRKGLMDTHSYNMLLAAQVKSQNLKAAEKIFEKVKTPDRTTFHILLNAHLKNCKNNKDKEVTNIWMEKMIQSGIVPNRKTFTYVMDGLAQQIIRYARLNELKDVKSTVQSVLNLNDVMLKLGHKSGTETTNTLLKCFTAANDLEQIEKIISTLDLPQKSSSSGGGGCGNCGCSKAPVIIEEPNKIQHKVNPDTYTFNMLIKYYLDNGHPNQAFEMYDTMVTLELDPDTVTYGYFILYYANLGDVEESLKYYHVMQQKGIPSNNHVYNALLNCSLKYPQKANLITPHLRTMLANGTAILDTVSQNILLSRFQQDHDLDTSFERFIDLIDFNTNAPSTRTYNTILQSSGKFYKSAVTSLDDVIRSLDISNVEPDVYTFALSIRNATYQGDMIKAESIFKSMTEAGIQPNMFVFSHLIYGYASIGKMDKAQDILRGMSAAPYNRVPTAINYAPLIKGYAENAEFEKAYALFREMLDKNITADLVIYTILAGVFLNSGNEKRAIELLEGISKAGISTDAASLTVLAEAYGLEGNIVKIDSIYRTLKERNLLDKKAITTLLKAYANSNNPEEAWKLWNDLKTQKQPLSTHHYNTLLTCLSPEAKAWYPVAKLVYEQLKQDSFANPDPYTYDLLIWGAYSVSDFDTIRRLWIDVEQNTPKLVRSYYAVITALVDNRQLDLAKQAYNQYRKLPTPPNSSTVWVEMIETLAKNHDFVSS
ncbi:hypothetical protein MFLAVUS_007966 [Mucor flavus]|uniref:PROP1-like PPR domain-containing protein n=1 Tax=Mucor flavus TaxID=439312 RepID=A0ABP9Z5U6_9FUNG